MRLVASKQRRAITESSSQSLLASLRAMYLEHQRAITIAIALAACACVGLLLFPHLDTVPRTWFDEGSHLHVPKTLVQTGHYADRSSEGFRTFGPTVSVGPMVMLPIAAVFKVAGISLLKARLVITLYALVALVAFLVLVRRLAGWRVGIIATVMMLATPGVAFISLGRQVLGEMPAFACLLCGLLIWFGRDDVTGEIGLVRCTKRCLLAGGFFGLVIVTKSQLGIVLVPALVLLAILAARWDRRIGLKQVIVPLVVMLVIFGGWELAILTIVTGGSFSDNFAMLRQASGGSLIVISPSRMLAAARFLVGPSAYFALLIPAVVYACIRAIKRRMSVGELVLLSFTLVGLLWFMGASIAWPRYAFVPLALAALPVARLIDDTIQTFWNKGVTPRRWVAAGAIGLTLIVALSFGRQFHTTFATSDDAPQRMAAYLNYSLPTSTIIETWEPELGFLTDHDYHFPTPSYLDLAVRHQWLGGPQPVAYDPRTYGATYVIVGPFARYTGLYDDVTAAGHAQRIAVIGDYTLYRLMP